MAQISCAISLPSDQLADFLKAILTYCNISLLSYLSNRAFHKHIMTYNNSQKPNRYSLSFSLKYLQVLGYLMQPLHVS